MKKILKALLALAVAASCAGASAAYPDRPLKIVVPYAPGGAPDALARLFAEELAKLLQQPVIVDNKPGAGSVIGTQFVASSPADGYTLLMVDSPFTTAPALYGNRIKYRVDKDFTPLVFVGTTPLYLYASGDSSIRNVADLVRLAETNGGGISYGSGGNGTLTHLLGEMLRLETRAPMTHVPYRSVTLAMGDLVAGQLQGQFSSYASARGYVDAGRIRPIAVTGTSRTKEAPETPTFAELGVKGFDMTLWWGVVAPAGVSPAVQARLTGALAKVMSMPQIIERLSALNINIAADVGPEALRKTIETDQARFQEIATRAQLKAE
ncbi:tripartite tricarboxylate transporter substrate-binding protein [Pantoea sp. 18069]|uniref:tripartite tricarboxylate transporter substrate-binding protein n=1 Tax=Pantoea sp. 18069 TaxID=2681415 RepID=UPI00135C65DE|nr:tripartite tricarboxylate transporter substrate-binding protein [Pantoea sp. 18069]